MQKVGLKLFTRIVFYKLRILHVRGVIGRFERLLFAVYGRIYFVGSVVAHTDCAELFLVVWHRVGEDVRC